jgi:hypothetical protein
MTSRRLASIAAAVAVAGCGSQISSSTGAGTDAGAGRSWSYELYTHCGIEWAKINGTFWRAKHPLSDGSGNPPPGWGNPYQMGTLALPGRTTARFTSTVGSVIFVRTSHGGPPFVCS